MSVPPPPVPWPPVILGGRAVSRLGLAAAGLGGRGMWGVAPDRAGALKVLRRAAELGIGYIDATGPPGPYAPADLVRDALAPYPAGLVLAARAPAGAEPLPNRIESHLRRLGAASLDLLLVHSGASSVEPDELEALVAAGTVRWVGLAGASPADVDRARRHLPVAAVSGRFDLADTSAAGLLRYAEAEGLVFVASRPMAGAARPEVAAIGARLGATAVQVAMAWLRASSPALLVVAAPASVAELDEIHRAGALVLGEQDRAELMPPHRPAGATPPAAGPG